MTISIWSWKNVLKRIEKYKDFLNKISISVDRPIEGIFKMAKFKVLKYNQTLMSWQGIHSMNLTQPTNEFHRSLSSYYIAFTLFAFVITSAVRIYGYWPAIELILKPCSVAFGGVQCVGMFISIGLQMKRIKALHLELQRIIDEGIMFTI